ELGERITTEPVSPAPKAASMREQAAGAVKFDKTVSDNDRKIAEMLLKGAHADGVSDVKVEYQKTESIKTPEIIPEHKVIIDKIKEEAAQKATVENKPMEPAVEISEPEEFSEEKPFFDNYRIIGQVFGTYWIVEQNSSMFVIDQHAAHERILFERFSEKFKTGDIVIQDLLSPERLLLTDLEKDKLNEAMELIESFGFRINEDKGEYYMASVPYIFDKPATSELLMDILDTLKTENIKNVYDTKLLNLATMACKAAVKSGDKLSVDEAEGMIKELLSLKNPFSCPHGRPTIIEMTQYELEKKFKRIQ
ncbi:MAG: hypothetical protein LUE88_08445, partial [Clostridiales bacterium]|nr:hypothetical protein [Clostridiales bacterium]